MRILVISTNIFPLPPKGYSGLEMLVYNWAVGFQKAGHQVSVVAPEGTTLPEGMDLIATKPGEGNPMLSCEDSCWVRYKDRLLTGAWDAVMDNSWAWASIAGQMEHPKQLPVVHCYHSDPRNLDPASPPPIEHPCLVAFSNHQAEHITSRWRRQVRMVYHGVDTSFYRPDPAVERSDRYLFLARYCPEKGFLDIANIARKCRVGLDAFGDTTIIGPHQAYAEECFRQSDGAQIKVNPGISREQVAKEFQGHKALITWPNFIEIFGLCVHPSTPIDTAAGTVAIPDVPVGGHVISKDGQYHKVLAKTKRAFNGEMIQVTPSGINLPVSVTPEHPYWTMARVSSHRYAAPEWIPARELRPGDILLSPILRSDRSIPDILPMPEYKRNTRNKTLPADIRLSRDFWTLAGYYLAEGSTAAGNHTLSLSFNSTEVSNQREVSDLFDCLFALKAKVRERSDSNGVEIQAYAAPVARLFHSFGGHSWEKHIPEGLWPLPDDAARALLRSYFKGDGHYDEPGGHARYPTYAVTTVSMTLAHQVKHLLLRLGFLPHMSRYVRGARIIKGRRVMTQMPYYRISITGPQTDAFLETVMGMAKTGLQRQRIIEHRFIHKDWLYLPIKNVVKVPYSGEVHDLQVEGQSSFVSNGVLLHNTTVEAMCCGCPVISKDSGAARELIVHGKTGFVVNTFDEAVELVQSNAVSQLKTEDIIEQGRKFSIEASVAGHLSVLNDVAQGNYW